MGAPRRIARALLEAALRLAPPASADWAAAMLHELDFIPGEWSALRWALGSSFAILRHAILNWRQYLVQDHTNGEKPMNSTGKKVVGIASGAISALMLAGCTFALLRLADMLFPQLGIAHTEWTHWLVAIVLPEAIFISAAALLWRRKGPVAAGILLTAAAIGLHVVIHLVRR